MNQLLKNRARKATDNACNVLNSYSEIDAIGKELKTSTANAVRNRIDKKYIVSESGNILVTEIGFVTMAVLAGHAIYRKDLLLIPGVDEKNQFGYLVLRSNCVPYHSLAKDIDGAVADTQAAHNRASALLDYYGSKDSLKQAAQSAPWYQISTMDDAWNAGMCRWGAISFLERAKLSVIGRHVGIPRCFFSLVGGYGDRVTASTIRRQEQKFNAKRRANTQSKTQKRNHA